MKFFVGGCGNVCIYVFDIFPVWAEGEIGLLGEQNNICFLLCSKIDLASMMSVRPKFNNIKLN